MGSTVIDMAFGEFLIESGLQRMSSNGIYRGTHRSDTIPGGQNVFVSIGDSEDLSVMCPIGPADEIKTDDLDVARDADDGCSTTVAGGFGALIRPLNVNDFITEPGNIIARAIELAEYVNRVRARMQRNQARKFELLQMLQTWSNDPDQVSWGRVSPDQFEATVREVLDLIPKQGLLDDILQDSMNENMRHWLTSGVQMSESPWHEVVERLQRIKSERGWKSDIAPNLFSHGAGAGDDSAGGQTGSLGNIWDEELHILGSVDSDGSVWDTRLNKLGSVDSSGKIWNASINILGSVDTGGRIWNNSLEILGSADANGKIWDSSLHIVGSFDGRVSAEQAAAAAVLLGLVR